MVTHANSELLDWWHVWSVELRYWLLGLA